MTVELRTERLRMRGWSQADRAPFAALNADPAVMEHFPSTLGRADSDRMVDLIDEGLRRRGWGLWAVEVRADRSFIGFIGLHPVPFEADFTPAVEVGWRLARGHWNNGYATEGARAALHYAFESLRLDRVVSFTAPANVRSRAVMEKLGMSLVGEFDHPHIAEGHRLRRHVLYALDS